MSETSNIFKKTAFWVWCAGIIGSGVLLFVLLSAFGAFRYWQAEKIPQGKTDLSFAQV